MSAGGRTSHFDWEGSWEGTYPGGLERLEIVIGIGVFVANTVAYHARGQTKVSLMRRTPNHKRNFHDWNFAKQCKDIKRVRKGTMDEDVFIVY